MKNGFNVALILEGPEGQWAATSTCTWSGSDLIILDENALPEGWALKRISTDHDYFPPSEREVSWSATLAALGFEEVDAGFVRDSRVIEWRRPA